MPQLYIKEKAVPKKEHYFFIGKTPDASEGLSI